jgi:DNA-binding HxlR family transcriptional regulator
MERKRFEGWPCPLARAVDVVGDAWSPLIVRELLLGTRRFDELVEALGISRGSLTRRLAHLEKEGVLERRPYRTAPVRHEYVLTPAGEDLAPVLASLLQWGRTWRPEGGDDTRFIDRRGGRDVNVTVVDRRSQEPVTAGRFGWVRAGDA